MNAIAEHKSISIVQCKPHELEHLHIYNVDALNLYEIRGCRFQFSMANIAVNLNSIRERPFRTLFITLNHLPRVNKRFRQIRSTYIGS